MKHDRYRQTRGGYSRMLELTCRKCKNRVCHYQKDGAGELRRLYLDRMLGFNGKPTKLQCGHCDEILGLKTIFQKEQRPAYRLFVGAIERTMVAKSKVH